MADPLYQRIANDLRTQIETGQLQPRRATASGRTAGQAVQGIAQYDPGCDQVLDQPGPGRKRAGQGTFVVDPPDPLVTTLTTKEPGLGGGEGAAYLYEASERNPRSDIPTVELQTALGEIAYRLGVPEGTPVVSRHERRFIRSKRADQPTALDSDETPWSMQTSFYPRSFAPQAAERLLDKEDIKEGTVEYLKNMLKLTRSAIVTGSQYARRKMMKSAFSGYRLTAEFPCSRSFVQRLIKTEIRCV